MEQRSHMGALIFTGFLSAHLREQFPRPTLLRHMVHRFPGQRRRGFDRFDRPAVIQLTSGRTEPSGFSRQR